MPSNRLLVTTPLLEATREVVVEGAGDRPVRVKECRFELAWEPFLAARAARDAGAEVFFMALAEPVHAAEARARLDADGIRHEIVEVAAASRGVTRYLDAAGEERFLLDDERPPAGADVDRLLDRIGAELVAGARLVLTVGDLPPSVKIDFIERVIGRAWGLGIKTVTAVNGASLKQAFHAQPLGCWLREEEARVVAPPAAPDEELAATLRRIFEDPVRVLLLRREDGGLLAATRDAREELGPGDGVSPAALMGALAGRLVAGGWNFMEAARAAYASARPGSAAGLRKERSTASAGPVA